MVFRRIFAITVIVLSLSTGILSQSEEMEVIENYNPYDSIFERTYGPGLTRSCPPDMNNNYEECEKKAKENFSLNFTDPVEETTATQHCRFMEDIIACRKVAYESCKSQLANVAKEMDEEADKDWWAIRFDCKALTEHPNTYDPSQDDDEICPPQYKYIACVNVANNNVISGKDYAVENTYAQHCRNRDDMLECFRAGFENCTKPFAPVYLARTVRGVRKAYLRFDCDEPRGSAHSSKFRFGFASVRLNVDAGLETSILRLLRTAAVQSTHLKPSFTEPDIGIVFNSFGTLVASCCLLLVCEVIVSQTPDIIAKVNNVTQVLFKLFKSASDKSVSIMKAVFELIPSALRNIVVDLLRR